MMTTGLSPRSLAALPKEEKRFRGLISRAQFTMHYAAISGRYALRSHSRARCCVLCEKRLISSGVSKVRAAEAPVSA